MILNSPIKTFKKQSNHNDNNKMAAQHESITTTANTTCSSSVDNSTPPTTTATTAQTVNTNTNNIININKKRKMISFSAAVKVREVLHIDDYTDEEYFACWYTDDELRQIRRNVRMTIVQMEEQQKQQQQLQEEETVDVKTNNDNDISSSSSLFCTRGLESYTHQGIHRKQNLRKLARNVVFYHQDLQFEEMIWDPETIAQAYAQKSRRSQELARIKAHADELWVQKYGNSTDSSSSSDSTTTTTTTTTTNPRQLGFKKWEALRQKSTASKTSTSPSKPRSSKSSSSKRSSSRNDLMVEGILVVNGGPVPTPGSPLFQRISSRAA